MTKRIVLQRHQAHVHGPTCISHHYDVVLKEQRYYYYGKDEPEGQLVLECTNDTYDKYVSAVYCVFDKILFAPDCMYGVGRHLMKLWQADRDNITAKIDFGTILHHHEGVGWNRSLHSARRIVQAMLLDLHTMAPEQQHEAVRHKDDFFIEDIHKEKRIRRHRIMHPPERPMQLVQHYFALDEWMQRHGAEIDRRAACTNTD